jgi:hypothetical protein
MALGETPALPAKTLGAAGGEPALQGLPFSRQFVLDMELPYASEKDCTFYFQTEIGSDGGEGETI